MYSFDFPVHGRRATAIVTPKEEQAILRSEPIKPSPKIKELGVAVGDMYFFEDRRRTIVVREINENAVKCVFQRTSGDFAEEDIGAFTFKAAMRLVKRADPEYWHSYLLRPQVKGKTYQSKPKIVELFKTDERIRKIGEGKHLAFHIEDIKEHYPWYKF